ncbi:S8 family peptidase [Snodgrassella communis]|uniref:S8 family peptidase n=1 Tax=Snodgrassella communis TaxID=2946699 RepID=UPI001EF679C1|nr:S8 family peptidase [Snodgrassella communis]
MANNVLELKGKAFAQASKVNGAFNVSINGNKTVSTEHLSSLKLKLEQIAEYWQNETRPFTGILISVYYNKIAAKSNRITGLFKGKNSNSAVVGAKFNRSKTKHIITYYLDVIDLTNSISLLQNSINVLNVYFNGPIDKEKFNDKEIMNNIPYKKFNLSKSAFKQVIADASYIDDFNVEETTEQIVQGIITLYDTKTDTVELLEKYGIKILSSRILDRLTVYLDANQTKILSLKAPYLISMAAVDLSCLSPEDFIQQKQQEQMFIPSPNAEPTIGVIDTLFDQSVYFNEWVEYHNKVDASIPKTANDYKHGTAISSIIVDGPRLNPWLEDGCGRFKVRHFGVATGAHFSSFTIIKQIKEIIAANTDIKVWNLSLGSEQEINDNFISAEGAVLDQIQYDNDVIFVIAGTNKPNEEVERIGSPADSINSMVVNSVTKNNLPPKYGRKGIVLSFFAKPDVSYYGGSDDEYICVHEGSGETKVAGTSFAAPWIARKLSYLIDVLGLNRELAKAMIIDAAKEWKQPNPQEIAEFGHGIVPIHINDIITTKEGEVKFVVTDVSKKWNTYNYEFPVPLVHNKYPFFARATMCYFPKCNRNQGVDYTNTELNLHFGRIDNKGKIKDINGDKQNLETDEDYYLSESDARSQFRKWDNVKYISESIDKKRLTPKCSYKNTNWGMEIKTTNRLDPKDGEEIRFGVVVTLKEMKGQNRIDEFIRNCHLQGWIVNKLDVNTRVEIHQIMNEDIKWD